MIKSPFSCPEEERDCKAMMEEIMEIKCKAFDMMREYSRMSEEGLKWSGHRKGNAEAVLSTLQKALKDIEKESKKFLAKWPDK